MYKVSDIINIGCDLMEQDLLKIKELLLQYIGIISKEFKSSNAEQVLANLDDAQEIVAFNDTDSISFFVRNGKLLLPKKAYSIFPYFKKYEIYGKERNNHRCIEEYLDTNTTYLEYIEHVITGALSVYDYFEESLLHEAMHICGSGGGTPLEEGINELKTRELAQKYNIKIAAYGYSKEVEVSKKLQQILGKEIMDELTFIPSTKRYAFISDKVGNNKAKLYKVVSDKMIEKSKEYFENISRLDDPFEKARLYEKIDYSEMYQIIDGEK